MPLREFIAAITPFGLIKEIEGRLALQLPDKAIKEQDLYENYQQTSARFTLVWWLDHEEEFKPAEKLKQVVQQVTETRDNIEVSLTDPSRSVDTGKMMVTINTIPESKEGRTADGPVKNIVVPMVLELGGNEYHIVSRDMGTTWDVTRDEELVETKLPSVAAAIGKLTKHLVVDVGNIEELDTGDRRKPDEVDIDFIVSLGEWFANSPVVTKTALDHLTAFVELLTKREFTPES